MNASLDHLPEKHQADLARLVDLIRREVHDAELIILFGSFARGDWKAESDLPPPEERRSGHPSDYDILVVTESISTGEDAALWERMSRRTVDMGLQTHARIIGYPASTINERLEEGRYFYVDIVKEGKMLYDSGAVMLAEPKELPPEKRKKLAREYYAKGMDNALGHYAAHEFHVTRREYALAAFNLHQATEAAYKTILLVFTHYSPHEHWLNTLGNEAAMHAPSVAGIFPLDTEEDEQRFMRLDEAYIGARYDRNYSISRADLELLADRVCDLLDRAKAVCEAELAKMA